MRRLAWAGNELAGSSRCGVRLLSPRMRHRSLQYLVRLYGRWLDSEELWLNELTSVGVQQQRDGLPARTPAARRTPRHRRSATTDDAVGRSASTASAPWS